MIFVICLKQIFWAVPNKGKFNVWRSKNNTVINRTFGKISVETIFSQINSWTISEDCDMQFVIITPRKVLLD